MVEGTAVMKRGLRTKLVGTLVGAIVISSAISAIAARNTMATDLNRLANRRCQRFDGFAGYLDQKRDTVKLLVTQAAIQRGRSARTAIRSKKLQASLTGIARQGDLSSSPSSTRKGTCSRAPRRPPGAALNSPFVKRALDGETISTAATIRTTSSSPSSSNHRSNPRSGPRRPGRRVGDHRGGADRGHERADDRRGLRRHRDRPLLRRRRRGGERVGGKAQ